MLFKLFNLSIVLYPILSAYALTPKVDIGLALCVGLGILTFWAKTGKIELKLPKYYFQFFIYTLIAALLVTGSFPIRLSIYTFILLLGCSLGNFALLYRYYRFVAVICVAFFFVQEFSFLLSGIRISGLIPFLPTIYDGVDMVTIQLNSERLSSFFLEPSYLAQFLAPCVVLELFYSEKKNRIFYAVLFSLAIVLSLSGNGMILLVIMWLFWIFMSDAKKSLKFGLLALGILAIFLLFQINPEVYANVIDRSSELSLAGAGDRFQSSGFIRFFRGYFLYAELPSIGKIFGVSPETVNLYMKSKLLGVFDFGDSFMNGVSTILCIYGAVGLLLFIPHLLHLYRQCSSANKALVLCVIFLLLGESYFICSRMLLTMILMFHLSKKSSLSFS